MQSLIFRLCYSCVFSNSTLYFLHFSLKFRFDCMGGFFSAKAVWGRDLGSLLPHQTCPSSCRSFAWSTQFIFRSSTTGLLNLILSSPTQLHRDITWLYFLSFRRRKCSPAFSGHFILSTEFILPPSFLLFLLIRSPVICKFLQFQHYAMFTHLLPHLLSLLKPQVNE